MRKLVESTEAVHVQEREPPAGGWLWMAGELHCMMLWMVQLTVQVVQFGHVDTVVVTP